jgi:hypothetical protein
MPRPGTIQFGARSNFIRPMNRRVRKHVWKADAASYDRWNIMVVKFIAHSKKAVGIAQDFGWFPGARYTNLRDVRTFNFESRGFLDINWKQYDFRRHLDVVAECNPRLTIARDIERMSSIDAILREAELLSAHAAHVAIVPKDPRLNGRLAELIPKRFLLGYSVPTKYGGTTVSIASFDRPVHLLGGRPDTQRALANQLKVFSLDCNRFTLDAQFGDYFDGQTFRPHPRGGYERCLRDSLKNINALWNDYELHPEVIKILKVDV